MKIFDVEQGTPEWLACRLGIPTASCFGKILTATGKASAQAEAYMLELVAERVTGDTVGFDPTLWMQRGTSLEAPARDWYAMQHDVEVLQVGFALSDHGYGCSPDGLVEGGLIEIKCPKPGTHVGYVLKGQLPSGYKPQVQGQLLVCEREWCDFVSYLPGANPMVIRVGRDDGYIKTLHDALVDFVGKLSEAESVYLEKSECT